jgi:uncharacterized protein YjiS (DUF1127 family)
MKESAMSMAQISEGMNWRKRDRDGSGLIALLKTWRRRADERQTLVTMSDIMLRDIGITRCDAMNEASKPFWRA